MRYTDRHGRQQYQGYIKDLLDAVMSLIKQEYTLYTAADGKYGNIQPGGVWNGMVNELLQRVIHFEQSI